MAGRPHRITVQGTLGGIVLHCDDCNETVSVDFPSEVADWKAKHEDRALGAADSESGGAGTFTETPPQRRTP
jgi:hypothetical protein